MRHSLTIRTPYLLSTREPLYTVIRTQLLHHTCSLLVRQLYTIRTIPLHLFFALDSDSRNQWCSQISLLFLYGQKKGNLMVLQVLSGNLFEYNVLSIYAIYPIYFHIFLYGKGTLWYYESLSGNPFEYNVLSIYCLLRYYYATTMLLLCYGLTCIYSSSSSSDPLAITVSSSLSLSVHNSASSSWVVIRTKPFESMLPTASLPYCE